VLLSITDTCKSPISGYVLSVNYEQINRTSYLFQLRCDPNGHCLAISRAVTKITVININCIQPFNDEPYILLH
jgi:hypothetical protein